jgi:hypothetical protein
LIFPRWVFFKKLYQKICKAVPGKNLFQKKPPFFLVFLSEGNLGGGICVRVQRGGMFYVHAPGGW